MQRRTKISEIRVKNEKQEPRTRNKNGKQECNEESFPSEASVSISVHFYSVRILAFSGYVKNIGGALDGGRKRRRRKKEVKREEEEEEEDERGGWKKEMR